jgi:hypothetical protein
MSAANTKIDNHDDTLTAFCSLFNLKSWRLMTLQMIKGENCDNKIFKDWFQIISLSSLFFNGMKLYQVPAILDTINKKTHPSI